MAKYSESEKLAILNDYRSRNNWPPLDTLEGRDPRAVAKLSHAEQCEIKAYCFLEVPKPVIAAVFVVTINTVMRVNAANFHKYPKVFAAVMAENTVYAFCHKWITEKNLAEVKKACPRLEWKDSAG